MTELERFTSAALGDSAWPEILRDAGLVDRVYVPVSSYPDHEMRDIVVAASRRTGVGVDRVLFDFGRFLAPDLLRNYRHLLQPDWRTLDVIEHTDAIVHRAVRGGASVPSLAVARDESGLVISYRSRRGLCAMARGIVIGLADSFGEHVSVREPQCSQRGGGECTIQVRELRSTDQHIPVV